MGRKGNLRERKEGRKRAGKLLVKVDHTFWGMGFVFSFFFGLSAYRKFKECVNLRSLQTGKRCAAFLSTLL